MIWHIDAFFFKQKQSQRLQVSIPGPQVLSCSCRSLPDGGSVVPVTPEEPANGRRPASPNLFKSSSTSALTYVQV